MKEITEKQLKKILNGKLSTKKCPKCGGGIVLTVKLPIFAANGIKVNCGHCDFSIKLQSINTVFATKTIFATPITFNSVARALFCAVSEWNKTVAEYRNKKGMK